MLNRRLAELLRSPNVAGRPIQEVLQEHTARWMATAGVVGTAIGEFEGRPCIKVFLAEEGKSEFNQRIRARLKLPQTKKKLQLVIDSVRNQEKQEQEIVAEDKETDLSLMYFIRKAAFDNLKFRAGLRFAPEPVPYTGLRWHADYPWSVRWNFRPTLSLIWKSQEGFGETGTLEGEHLATKPIDLTLPPLAIALFEIRRRP